MSGESHITIEQTTRLAVARRIDHVAIATLDAGAAAAWYTHNFGMAIVGDEIVESAGVRLVYLAPRDRGPDAASMVQLAEPFADGNMRDFIERKGEGLHHICFAVDDIEQALYGVDQSADTIFAGGRERRTCFLDEQPVNVLIELTEVEPGPGRTEK